MLCVLPVPPLPPLGRSSPPWTEATAFCLVSWLPSLSSWRQTSLTPRIGVSGSDLVMSGQHRSPSVLFTLGLVCLSSPGTSPIYFLSPLPSLSGGHLAKSSLWRLISRATSSMKLSLIRFPTASLRQAPLLSEPCVTLFLLLPRGIVVISVSAQALIRLPASWYAQCPSQGPAQSKVPHNYMRNAGMVYQQLVF